MCQKNIEIRVIQAITPHWSVDPKDKIREIRAIRVQRNTIRMVNPSYSSNPTMLFMKSWLLTQQAQILRQLKIVKIILSKVE